VTHHIRWQILLILLGVVLVGILLTYLAINYTTVLRPGRGGTYVESIAGFPRYLNPLLSGYNEVDRDICALVFSGLTRLNERGEVEPDLARGWEVALDSPTGTVTYTFYLRSNAYWHDGVLLTADDVVFTVGLLQAPDFRGPPDLGSTLWQMVSVEKVDRHTVRFTLPEPYAPFLDYTTVGILPVHLLRGIQAADLPTAEFNLNPVGSGPFQLEELQVEADTITAIVLEKSSRYYQARPYLDRVQFRFYPSYQAAFSAYEAEETEGIAGIVADDLPRTRDFLFSAHIAEYGIVFLNLARSDLPFFQEQEVRQALLYALDRQQVIDSVLKGQALVAHSPFIPGTWAYKNDIHRYEHDPDTASELLDEAGWIRRETDNGVRRKQGRGLAFTLLTSCEPERMGVAQMLAEQWATIGVTVTVEAASPLEVREALEKRDFEAIIVHLASQGDPDPYPFWHETQVENGQNYAGFAHRRISETVEQARIIVNRERRRGLYYEFQEIFAQEVPALLLYVPVYTYGVDERIHDLQIGPLMHPSDRFRTISEWWIVPRRVFVSESEASRP
jgi:peptide/nickel transport system substrate-binding protein